MHCPSCGEEVAFGFRFCGRCGAAVREAAAVRELRKVVTVVFCDLSGSTALADSTDPEAMRATMRSYYEQMRTILERHGGTVEKFIGDAVMAVFSVPVAHEDDALRAVRAAWEMRAAVPELGLRARIGVNTGEVMAGDGDALVTGDAVNVAARLEQAAEVGEVLIGAETQRLVRDAVAVVPVEISVKGKPGLLAAFQLTDVDLEAAPVARRLDTPLIGRRTELEQLMAAFERTVREGRCHLFTLLGVAGVGKSRLVAEFLSGVEATVLHGRCLDYGEGITFFPVVSVLKQLGDRGDPTVTRLVAGASTPNELFYAVRVQLEEVARERPLVVCFDDIQWGETTFFDLVDHVADLSRDAPLLLLCLARPELLDKRPGWGGGKLNATTVLLEPLRTDECLELIAVHGGIDAETRERVLAAADGNPLFIEEMVALARENGDVRIPGTVQALLQARLDQLGAGERSVIEHGAVEGQVFHRSAVVELAQTGDLEPQIAGLVRKELIRPTAPTFPDDHAFRFRHLLIRDAAYDALPKETRAELHERFASWLERHGRDLVELDEVLGYHLEQAARYRRELGRPSPELELRAGRALASSGARAAARSDRQGSLNLLRRAISLLPEGDARGRQALLDELFVLEIVGEVDERLPLIESLERSDDRTLQMHGRIARFTYLLQSEPEHVVDAAEQAVADALPVFAAADDDLGAAHAYHMAALASWLRSRSLATVSALEHVFEHAGRIDARIVYDQAAMMMLGPLRYGPFTPREIRERLEILRISDSALTRQSVMLVEANLYYMDGRVDDALNQASRAASIADELGLGLFATFARWEAAHFLDGAGRLDEAAEALIRVSEAFEALEQTSFRSTVLLDLAKIRYKQGALDDAERLVADGQAAGATEDVINFAYGQGVRGRIAADRGDHSTAEPLAREALTYAYRTDFPGAHAVSLETLAYVLAAAGRKEEARVENMKALELWERYGYALEANRTRTLI